MNLVICPGIHDLELTESFLTWLRREAACCQTSPLNHDNLLIFPSQNYLAVSAFHILQMLRDRFPHPRLTSPLVFIGFSAGVVGAIGAAWGWQLWGGSVKALIALDGWGVPLSGNFPIHRLSHDYFTHWSSALLGSGQDSFYADPPVSHLELWRSPQTIAGWWEDSVTDKSQPRSYTTAALFMTMLLKRYGEC